MNPNHHGPCPYCGSAISCVTRDEMTYARCSHRGCGARGPMHRSLDRAVALFRREHAAMLPSAEVVESLRAAVNATHTKPRCSACDGSGYTEEPDEDEHGGMCRSLSWVPCRECAKPMTPTPANDPEPDVCSSCAEAGELSGDSGGFGVETIGGGTEWFGTLDEAWSAMGPGRRVVTHG